MNTIVGIGEDGFPIIGADFSLQPKLRIGKLTVLGRAQNPINAKTGKVSSGAWWECVCDCGKHVVKRSDNLKAGATRGGPAAQKNKGCRTCGDEACNNSGIKNRNTTGMIQSTHTNTNVGGAEIIRETDYIDLSNRSTIVACRCKRCGQPFFTTRRSESTTCGCGSGMPRRTLEEYVSQRGCRSQGELKIQEFFDKVKVPYIQEKKFADCADVNPLPFDFYLNSPKNGPFVVEFDGEQHFRPVDLFGGEERFKIQRKHDMQKNRYCWDHGIRVIRIPTMDFIPNKDLSIVDTRFEVTPQNEAEYFERWK